MGYNLLTFQQPDSDVDFNQSTVRELADNECPRHTSIGIEVEGTAESEGLRRIHLWSPEERQRLDCTCKRKK